MFKVTQRYINKTKLKTIYESKSAIILIIYIHVFKLWYIRFYQPHFPVFCRIKPHVLQHFHTLSKME